MMKIAENVQERVKKIKVVVFDVDGTLTDGKIYMGNQGELCKAFDCRDGMGITLAHKAGLKTAIITGRKSAILANRAAELKISAVWQGIADKRGAYQELKEKFQVNDEEIAYVGDDLNDYPLLKQVGLPCAVGNAVAEVKSIALLGAEAKGGEGAVRELLEFIIKEKGLWSEATAAFLGNEIIGSISQ